MISHGESNRDQISVQTRDLNAKKASHQEARTSEQSLEAVDSRSFLVF